MLVLFLLLSLSVLPGGESSDECSFVALNNITDDEEFTFPGSCVMADNILTVNVTMINKDVSTVIYSIDKQRDSKFLVTFPPPSSEGSTVMEVLNPSYDYKTLLKFQNSFEFGSPVLIQVRCTSENCTVSINNTVQYIQQSDELEEGYFSAIMADNIIWIPNSAKPLVQFGYISICRPTEPTVELTTQTDMNITEYKACTMICKISGPPPLTGTWSKDNDASPLATHSTLDDSQPSHTLMITYTIPSLSTSDEGGYVCKGRSTMVNEGYVSSSTVTVTIREENEDGGTDGDNETDETALPPNPALFGTGAGLLLLLIIIAVCFILKRATRRGRAGAVNQPPANDAAISNPIFRYHVAGSVDDISQNVLYRSKDILHTDVNRSREEFPLTEDEEEEEEEEGRQEERKKRKTGQRRRHLPGVTSSEVEEESVGPVYSAVRRGAGQGEERNGRQRRHDEGGDTYAQMEFVNRSRRPGVVSSVQQSSRDLTYSTVAEMGRRTEENEEGSTYASMEFVNSGRALRVAGDANVGRNDATYATVTELAESRI